MCVGGCEKKRERERERERESTINLSTKYTWSLFHLSTRPLERTIDELREELDKERHRRESMEKVVDESRKQILVLTMNCDQLKAQALTTSASKTNLKQPIA